MKNLFLIILTSITIQISAQEFAPIGAKWHYSQGTLNPELIAFKTIESISDTVIEGKSCKKLNQVSAYIPPNRPSLFLYSKNDSVLVYEERSFHLLYDFGAVKGDTIELGYLAYNGSPLKMIIDSTGTITINGQLKKLQYVTCGDGMVIEFGGKVIEGIGNTEYMFPRLDGNLDGPLRCYENNILGLFLNPFHPNNGWDFQNCEQIITGINDLHVTETISIYPNPVKSSFTLTNLDRVTEFEIFDIHGRKVMKGIVNFTQVIKIEDLPKGLYFLKLQNSKLFRIVKIEKQ
ncbi:MAG: T9SS type A sorting domain-containing protein [Saprospiraceae bacterium]|nr:T9SS type A sorting domain-containing protein [Saprospiraceae bacterium]